MQPNEVVAALAQALGSANDNLPDVMCDGHPEMQRECLADSAALAHLLGVDATGQPRILAYL